MTMLGDDWRKGTCVARCLYEMATWHYDYKEKVRAIVKKIKPGTEHIQAQGFDKEKGEWRYLTMLRDGVVDYGTEEFPGYEITKTLTLAELYKERLDAET